jgi:hypothetical protein
MVTPPPCAIGSWKGFGMEVWANKKQTGKKNKLNYKNTIIASTNITIL